MRSIVAFIVVSAITGFLAVQSANGAGPYRGRSVESVLDELRVAGLPLVYSSNLVPPTLVVTAEPASADPVDVARDVLRPHGLALREAGGSLLVVRGAASPAPTAVASVTVSVTAPDGGDLSAGVVEAGATGGISVPIERGRAVLEGLAPGRHVLSVRVPGFLPERLTVSVQPGESAAVSVTVAPAAPALDELTVTASRYDLRTEVQPSASFFSREQIETLSELGDDTLRVAHRLPGVTSNEFSARSHVRGGAMDETAVLFDGLRLVEPYHLRDYQSVFSAIDQRIVSDIQVYSGGFPASYGDALSGLTVIEPREPTALHHELGISFLYTSVLSSGTFRGGRAQWLLSARRGNVDRLLNSELGEPSYGDAYLHLASELGSRHRLALNSIGFDDDVVVMQGAAAGDREEGRSATDNNQTWLTLDSDWSAALSSRTLLYRTDFSADRSGVVEDATQLFAAANDRREMEADGIKQDWRYELSERQALAWGFGAERLDARYRYVGAGLQVGVLATLGPPPPPRDHALDVSGERYDAYVSDRVRITDRLIAELGMRWDRQTYVGRSGDEQQSPRASVLYRVGAQTDVRLSYGRFSQAEAPMDLQVQDGVLEFAPAQDATHAIAGVDHRFENDIELRVELFRKVTRTARSRFENSFDPLELLPELRPGRVRVAPDRANARGVEIVVSGERPFSWWGSYSTARVDDIVGGVAVPRSWDQRHAANLGASWDLQNWTMSAAATLHSGWPATGIYLATAPGPGGGPKTIAVAGERNAERLEPVRRIDFRAARDFNPRVGSLRFFAEVTNVTNRNNPCCLRFEPVTLPDGTPGLERIERHGLPLMANVGLLWEF